MHRPTLLLVSLLFTLSTLSSALPSHLPASSSLQPNVPIAERGIGEEAERKLWRRQLINSGLNGLSWTLPGAASTTTSTSQAATETSTRGRETSSEETSSSTSSIASSTSASSSTTSTRSSPSSAATAATTQALKSRSIAVPSVSSSSASHSASSAVNAAGSAKKINAVQDSNIFNPSNKLFAAGIVVILASIVISIFIIIFIIKRISHSSRFIDPLDYPEKYPHHHSSSHSHILTSQPPSPSTSIDSYDSLEKQPLPPPPLTRSELAQIKRHEFGATVAAGGLDGGGPIARSIVNRPPLASLPSTPLPPRKQPFTNLAPLPSSNRSRAPPPAPLNLTGFSAPTFDRLARPQRAEKPLPSSSASPSHRPSYISTLPLSPTLKATAKREYFTHPNEPPRSFSTTPQSSRPSTNLTSLPPTRSNPPHPATATRTSSQLFPQPPPRQFHPSPRDSRIRPFSAELGQIVKHLPPAGNEYSVKRGRESPLRGEAFRREDSGRR